MTTATTVCTSCGQAADELDDDGLCAACANDDDCGWCLRPAVYCNCDEQYERYKDDLMGI